MTEKNCFLQFWYIPCFLIGYLGLSIPFIVLYRNSYIPKDSRDKGNSQNSKSIDFVLCDESSQNFYVIKDQVPVCLNCNDLYSGCTSCSIQPTGDRINNDNSYILANKETKAPDHSKVAICDDDLS